MSDGIRGKVVAIIDASSGIGAAAAEHLAVSGATVGLAARRAEPLHELVKRIDAAGGKAESYSFDATRLDQVKAVVQTLISRHGRLDVIINTPASCPCDRYSSDIRKNGTR